MDILHKMYAEESNGDELNLDKLIPHLPEKILSKNISYLVENNLIERDQVLSNLDDTFGVYALTSRGSDFLSENGGLTTEINKKLNTVSIKIDEEQFRAIIIALVDKADIPETQKSKIISTIKGLPAVLITDLATKLLDKGLESLIDVIQSAGIG